MFSFLFRIKIKNPFPESDSDVSHSDEVCDVRVRFPIDSKSLSDSLSDDSLSFLSLFIFFVGEEFVCIIFRFLVTRVKLFDKIPPMIRNEINLKKK